MNTLTHTKGANLTPYSACKKVRQWGNGLGLHIPKELTALVGLDQGNQVMFELVDSDTFTVRAVREQRKSKLKKYRMTDLVDLTRASYDYPPHEDWGTVGKERL